MTYSTGEAFIQTQIQALSSFPAGSVSRANWNIVNIGVAKTYAVLVPGPFNHEEDSLGGGLGHKILYKTTWTTICQLWTGVSDTGASMIDMETKRQDIINRFDAYRKAGDTGDTIRVVSVKNGGDPFEIVPEGGIFPVAYRHDMNIEWQEEYYATLQE